MRPFDKRLLTHARASTAYLVVCTAVGVGVTVLVLLQAWLLAHAIGAAFGGAHLAELRGTLWALAAVVGARAALAWLQEVAAQRSSAAVKSQLRRSLAAHALGLGPRWLAARPSGELVALMGSGLDALDAYFARYLPQLVLAVAVPAMVVGQLLMVDPIAATTIAVTLPLVPMFMVLVGLATQTQAQRRWRALAVLSHHFTDVVSGLPTLKVFGRARAQAAQVRRVTDDHRRATMGTLRLAFLSAMVLELLASLAVALVAVGVGLRLVHGGLDLQTALLVLLLAPEAYLPLRQVGAQHHASAEGLAAAGDAIAVLETPLPAAGRGTVSARRPVSVLELDRVEVGSPARSDPLLPVTSLLVRRGELVALTGPSGGGKSTLLDVLLRFVDPTAGRVLVDGLDLAEIDTASWRSRIAWVPQDPHLPEPTVGANVRLGAPSLTDEQVATALAGAGAAYLLPMQRTGNDGSLLSAGERRRVALARALAREAELLLLDEPTAGLDSDSETTVITTLRADARTVLVVTHRPALIAAADRVVAVGSGAPVPAGMT